MPKTFWFVLLLAVGAVGALFSQWQRHRSITPSALYQQGLARLEVPNRDSKPDYEGAKREFDLALAQAERSGDRELAEQILKSRADMYMSKGTLAAAQADYDQLLTTYAPGEINFLRTAGSLALRVGDLDRAFDYSDQLRAEDPLQPQGWAIRGRAIRAQIEDAMETTRALLDNNLADDRAELAHELSKQVASRSPDDPSRVALVDELEGLFGPLSAKAFAEVQRNLLAASHRSEMARQAFVESLVRQPNSDGLHNMLDILFDSGHYEAVVEVGLGAIQHPNLRANEPAVATLTNALHRMQRYKKAAEIIQLVRRGGMTRRTLGALEWCRILYDAEDWTQLRDVAATALTTEKAGRTTNAAHVSQLSFYLGMAFDGLSRGNEAQRLLDGFVTVPKRKGEVAVLDFQALPASEPFPGAMVTAHLTLAKLARRRNRKKVELESLKLALAQDPLSSPQAWARLFKLQRGNGAPLDQQEVSLVNTIRLKPELTEQLFPEWETLGRKLLLAENKDPAKLGAGLLREDGLWFPEYGTTPYELYRLAELHDAAGEPGGAAACLTELLGTYPYFGPARDRLVELYVTDLARTDLAIALLLDEIEHLGPQPETLAMLRSFPRESFSGRDMQRLIRHDPEYTGLFEVVEYLRDRDEIDRAYTAVASANFDVTGSQGRLIAGQLLVAQGEDARALQVLFPIPPEDVEFTAAIALRARAALSLGDDELLNASVGELADSETLDTDQGLALADRLMRARSYDAASLLLERLDATPSARSGSVFLRRARLALEIGDPSAAFEHLERSEAYLEDGSPELGRVLFAIGGSDWRQLPEELLALRQSRIAATPVQQALLLTLEDNIEAARPLFIEAQRSKQNSVLWLLGAAALLTATGESTEALAFTSNAHRAQAAELVNGSSGRARDPRELLGILIAIESDAWLPYAETLLEGRAAEATRPNLWVDYLRSECALRLGDIESAEEQLDAVVKRWPDFEPAWTELEALLVRRLRHRDHPDLLTFRGRRRDALKQGDDSIAEAFMLEAETLRRDGKLKEALERADSANNFAPEASGPLLLKARIEAESKQALSALRSYGQVFAIVPPGEARDYVPEFLTTLAKARIGGFQNPSAGSSLAENLLRLGVKLPNNPLVAVALAELDVARMPDSATIGVGRAWERLDAFQAQFGDVPLEQLAKGSTRAWFDFTVELDPRRAERLVQTELDKTPGNPDLYAMLADALVKQNRLQDGYELYERLLRILPEPLSLMRAASVLADICSGPAQVQALGVRFENVREWELGDPVPRYIRARAFLTGNDQARDFGIDLLAELWKRRDEPGFTLDPLELSWRYGIALTHRGLRTDRKRTAAIFEEVMPQLTSPLRKHVAQVLLQQSAFLPNKPPERAK